MDENTIMISLDTSTADSGVAVWSNGKLIEYFDLQKPKGAAPGNEWMTEKLFTLFAELKPHIVVLEEIKVFRNAKTTTELITLIGRIQGYCIVNNIFCYCLAPTEWRKQIVSGEEKVPRKREDAKLWAIEKVKSLYDIKEANDNICEAILIGQAYINLFGQRVSE